MPNYDKRDYSYRFLNPKKQSTYESAYESTDEDIEMQLEEEYRQEMSDVYLSDASIEIYMSMKKLLRERGSPLLDAINFDSTDVKALLSGEKLS